MTTYDEIYQFFTNNISVDQLSLPNTVEGQYEIIKNGVSHFNNKLDDNLVADDTTETVDRVLTNDEMLILTHIMKFNLLQKLLMYKSSILIGFTKELGVKNVGDQLKTLRELIQDEEYEINRIIFRSDDTDIMEG